MRLAITRQILLVLVMLGLVTALVGASPAPREFVPVQQGYSASGNIELPYNPTSLLVKFTREGLKKSTLNIAMEKGATQAEALTGLANIDALNVEFAVNRISRPFIKPANSFEADRLGVDRWFRMELETAADVEAMAARFASDPNIEVATPDWRAFPAATPNDPMFADNWGHNNTAQLPDLDWGGTYDHTLPNTVGTVGFDSNAQPAWDASQGYGSSSVVIAIIDSGVDVGHPDLRQVAGYDYGDNDSNPDDDSGQPGHGTACAGVAAAINNNGLGAVGVAGGCSIMPLKIANSAGSMYFSAIVNGIYHAADNGADIISMSLGAPISTDAATDAALQYAFNAGVTIFAATGNENASVISYPAINTHVISVGAASPCGERKRSSSSSTECNPDVYTDPNGYTCDGERWWGSNYGSTSQDDRGAVDIIAPTILPTTDIQGSGGYDSGDYSSFFNGTSCATPYAAGVAALIKSQNPSWTPTQIRDQIMTTAEDVTSVESGSGWDRYSGYGMIDAAAAVGGGGPVAPVAAFTGSPTSGQYPLDVAFNDQSTGSPTSWSWTFGDGGTSTAQNPSYIYTSAGTYTVSMTATNSVGSDVETKTGYITVTAPAAPVAAFTGAPTSGTYPLNVVFTDQSTGSPTSWSWTFGDGGTSTAQNPSYIYTAVGTYTVSLTATSAYGSDAETKTGYITVTEPGVTTLVTANGESSVLGTVTGTFANTAVSDGVNEVITEELYTGHPRKQYSYADHRWFFTLPAGGDATFHLEASRSDNSEGDNFVFEYSTDGVNYLPLATVSSSTEQSFSVSLGAVSGSVTVRAMDTNRAWYMTALDDLNVDYMAFELGDVQPVAPTADFSGTPVSGEYPLAVQFTDLSTADPTGWSWVFGDGGTSTVQNPGHTYTEAGTYTVSLTASNAQGGDTATKTGYITVTEPGTGGDTLHVSSINVYRVLSGRKYYGEAAITILDDGGSPVPGATVTALYTGDITGTLSGVTGTDGIVVLNTGRKAYATVDFCYEVTNVTHASLTYDSDANVVTKACEGGDVFSADARRIPTEFALSQNSPNPFNPMTKIQFNLPRDSNVSLRVYNLRGQVVETLVDRSMSAGEHFVMWDASSHASGVYFYRVEAPGFSETRKMIMLK
ncbi:MAG: S8 family serine peptidase [Gemmatimonadales bacterium]|nr:S8 family serine peptidase [Gemmatimonadales bacterium]